MAVFTIQIDAPGASHGRVRATGELDAANAHTLIDAVDVQTQDGHATSQTRIDLDLRGVSFCDAAGLRAVARAHENALAAAADVRVWLSPAIERIIDAQTR
jgi:anti-anti-sigma factor